MRKMKKLFACALALLGGITAQAQTDVTGTYLTNADFSQSTPIDNHLCGYGKDMASKGTTYYGLQDVTGWSKVVTAGDNSNATYPNSGMGGAVFAYGSSWQMKGNDKTPPATAPDESTGNCLGFFGVWSTGGYYYQDVTLPAGEYTINIPVYNQSGTSATTTYFGWHPTSGTAQTMATPTTTGAWTTLTKTFTLTSETAGQIRIGYKSNGGGSGANPMLFIDKVQILYTAAVVKDVLSTAINAASKANTVLNDATLTTAITTAQGVFDNDDATQEQVNAAAATLNAATEIAMSGKDVTNIFLTNADMSSTDGWTKNCSEGYKDIGNGLIGTYNVRFNPATVDETHLSTEYCFGFECRWQTNFASYYQTTEAVPAGVYKFTFDVENVNAATTKATYNNLFYAQVGDSKYTDSSTEWMNKGKSSWTTHTISATVQEAAPITISLGYGTGNNNIGADNTPALYVSHLKMEYQSFLAGAKEAYDNAVAAAATAKTNNANVTGEELTALEAELAKAEPTTVDGYNDATAAITAATTTLTNAAASYNALANINATIEATGTLEYADANKKPASDVTATSASDAATKAAEQTTALRAYYESNALAEGVDGAVDYTNAVAAANADTNTGWTNGVGTNQGQGYTDAAGIVAAKYLDGGWASNAACNIDMTREVAVHAGKYILTVTARGAEALTEYTLSIAGKTIDLPHIGGSNGIFGNGWSDATVEFESDGTPQTLRVVAKSEANQQWMSINRFRLVQLELNSDAYAGETEYTALNTAIDNAEAKTLGFNKDEYAPYNNVAAIEALTAAKAIDQEAELTNLKTTVSALTETLSNAIWTANETDVDAIYNGLFATVTEGANYPNGWTRTNGWGEMRSGIEGDYATAYYNQPGSLVYGSTGGYIMPLDENTVYKLTFAYRSHENNSNNAMNVSVLNSDSEGLTATNFGANGSTTEWKEVTKYFTTGAAGNYVLTLANGGNTWMTGVSLTKAVATDLTISEDEEFVPAEQYANVTFNRALVAGWNGIVLPIDMTVDDVKSKFNATEVKDFDNISYDENNGVTLNFTDATEVVAGKPVLIKVTEGGESYNLGTVITPANTTLQEVAQTAGNNANISYTLKGTFSNTNLSAVDFALIQGTKLYYHKANAYTTSAKAFRAYFENTSADTETGARIAFNFGDGETTGISDATRTNNAEITKGIFDLQGRKVQDMNRKGIYVVGGRKVVVK